MNNADADESERQVLDDRRNINITKEEDYYDYCDDDYYEDDYYDESSQEQTPKNRTADEDEYRDIEGQVHDDSNNINNTKGR